MSEAVTLLSVRTCVSWPSVWAVPGFGNTNITHAASKMPAAKSLRFQVMGSLLGGERLKTIGSFEASEEPLNFAQVRRSAVVPVQVFPCLFATGRRSFGRRGDRGRLLGG